MNLDTGDTVCIAQTTTGTAVFDGTQVGYATQDHTFVSGAILHLRATVPGTAGNSLKVVYVAPTGPVTATRVTWEAATSTLRVLLAGAPGAITDTAANVAAAINALAAEKRTRTPAGLPNVPPVVAYANTAGVLNAVGVASFTGGVDPTVTNACVVEYSTAANAGLVTFEQSAPWIVEQISGYFPGIAALTVTVKTVRVTPDLVPIADSEEYIFQNTFAAAPVAFLLSDPVIIMPGTAIVVTGADQGTIRVYARRKPSGLTR